MRIVGWALAHAAFSQDGLQPMLLDGAWKICQNQKTQSSDQSPCRAPRTAYNWWQLKQIDDHYVKTGETQPYGAGFGDDEPEREWTLCIMDCICAKTNAFTKPGIRKYDENWLLVYDNLPLPCVKIRTAAGFLVHDLNAYWSENNRYDGILIDTGIQLLEIYSTEWNSRPIVDLWPELSQDLFFLAGDLNDDCIADFDDFTKMAANWLIDCNADPNNPACIPKQLPAPLYPSSIQYLRQSVQNLRNLCLRYLCFHLTSNHKYNIIRIKLNNQ